MDKQNDTKDVIKNSSSKAQRETQADGSFYKTFGFKLSDISSWNSFIKLLHRPSDPANLAIFRILYGLLMTFDIVFERGLSYADLVWGDEGECRFPLFNFLEVLPLQWMYVVYLMMALGAFGITLGFMYRVSCAMFVTTYWYVYLLDKTSWNNHSYLFGLFSFMLLFMDCNRYWSVDGLIWPSIRNSHIPLWNYTLARFQIFLVYFIAGLKKIDMDWMSGYSMDQLGGHWVFDPFRYILTDKQIDLIIVHHGGLILDLTLGYLLFFDRTRKFAFFFGGSFHIMNTQLFSIGMFPYTMLATMPIFSSQDWPRKIFNCFPSRLQCLLPVSTTLQNSIHCIYDKEVVKPEESQPEKETSQKHKAPIVHSSPQMYHKMATFLVIFYVTTQCFLPYSHFLTKGYNNWTNGLYGYSWDMMVHSWSNQHIRVTYVNKDTGEVGYLNPKAFVDTNRWTSHADMAKQHAICIAEHLKEYNIKNVGIYFDVWKSMNDRFQQRMFDPRVDILAAEWHPFKDTHWSLPLLVDLSDWRGKLKEIEEELRNNSLQSDVVFVADFPGLVLENFIQEELRNTTITVLKGDVIVELVDEKKNISLGPKDSIQVPAGKFHSVHTVSKKSSSYMYIYYNSSESVVEENYSNLMNLLDDQNITLEAFVNGATPDIKDNSTDINTTMVNNETMNSYKDMAKARLEAQADVNATTWQKTKTFFFKKYDAFSRSISMTAIALESLVTGQSLEKLLEKKDILDGKLSGDDVSTDNAEVAS